MKWQRSEDEEEGRTDAGRTGPASGLLTTARAACLLLPFPQHPRLQLNMSASSDLVLVTGGTGFIGSHIVNELLANGHKVRAASRSESSAEGLRKRFEKEVASGALSFVYVPDITADGAFDAAVKGVSGIIHAASPLPLGFKGNARQEILDPAIKGATGILRSASKESGIKSFVLTTSGACHSNAEGPNGAQISDDSWSDIPLEEAETSKDASIVYRASKLHAEKAAWALLKELGEPFLFATVAPVYVAGPTLLPTHNVSQGTNGILWQTALGNVTAAGDEYSPKTWVHVKDVAEAHVRALNEPKANGKRFLLCADAGTVSALDAAKLARKVQPGINSAAEPSKKVEEHEHYEVRLANNAKNILGINFTSIDQIVKEVVDQGLEQRKAGIIQ